MNNKKKIKASFSKINMPNALEKQILNIPNKNQKVRTFSFAYIATVFLIMCTLSLSIIYAKEIKQIFQNWSAYIDIGSGKSVNVSTNNHFKEIPSSAIIDVKDRNSAMMSYQDIENILKFNILKQKSNNTNEIYYKTHLNKDNSLGKVELWIPYFDKENAEKYISANISILNKNADEGYILAQENYDATGAKNIKDTYLSINLNTNIILYNNAWNSNRITATFVYDDILYMFIGTNTSEEEIKTIIEELTY